MAVIRINEIIDRLLSYHPQADIAVVQKAYVWSAKLHAGSLRKSGLPYLSHPLEVAGILTELKLHESAIAAGLLHDVLEDSTTTLEDLESVFGKEISRLVDGVTKIAKITADSTRIEVLAENYRKMILAMAQDIRVILIKLADRLHNMQTLEYLEEEKQRIIAQETKEIYAPIAGRLGIHWIQAQLEDLSFRHLKPELYFRLAAQVAKTREARQEYIERVQTLLASRLREAGIETTIRGRFKHLFSIYRKMEKQKLSFEEVHDIVAFRILVNTIPDCYDALRVIHSSWTPVPGRIKDYIALPKPNLYRSLHTTVIGPDGDRVEVQIRTQEMHAVAEYGIAAHWRYKRDGAAAPSPEAEAKAFEFVSHLVEFQEEMKDPYHFLESVKSEVIPDEIVVFTPKGDLIELPAGATPIDFAYAIHSDIGNHSAGAKVNGRIVPLNHPLQGGDTVEILTSASVEPAKAWQEIVKSPLAKAKIDHWILTKETLRARELGRQLLEAEFLRNHRALAPLLEDGTMLTVARRFSFATVNRLFEAIGFQKFPVRKVLLQLVPPQELRPELGAKKAGAKPETAAAEPPKAPPETVVIAFGANPPTATIRSFRDPDLVFGTCCSPLVGEEVAALRQEGGLVEIHRADCPHILDAHPERILPAAWAPEVEGETAATLEIFTQDQKGMLARLSSVISDANLNIERAVIHTSEDKKATHTFRVTLKNLAQLQRVVKGIEKIEGVISVRRV